MTISSPAVDHGPCCPCFDGHVDLLYSMQQTAPGQCFADLGRGQVTPHSLRAGQVSVMNSALYCADAFNGANAVLHLREQLLMLQALTRSLPRIRTRADLADFWQEPGGTAQLLLLENADALTDLGPGLLAEAGIFTVGLTHAGSNRLADGNNVGNPAGLKPAGRTLLKQLEATPCAIDLAHLAEPAFWELLGLFEGPVCVSHTGLQTFCDRPRNLSADQIEAVLARDGMIGLSIAPEMLSSAGPADLDAVFRQLDWLVEHYGPGGIGLGTDLGGFAGPCRGLEDHGGLPALAERLQEAGYPPDVSEDLFGGNWLRFYLGILPGE